jgi:hypothetical protein
MRHTVVFAISSHTQAPRLDRGKAKPDGLAEGGGVDVRNSILIAYPTVREVKALTWNVAIRVGSVVSCQPVTDSNPSAPMTCG